MSALGHNGGLSRMPLSGRVDCAVSTARVVSNKGWDAMEKGQNLAALRVPRPSCASSSRISSNCSARAARHGSEAPSAPRAAQRARPRAAICLDLCRPPARRPEAAAPPAHWYEVCERASGPLDTFTYVYKAGRGGQTPPSMPTSLRTVKSDARLSRGAVSASRHMLHTKPQ